MKSILFVCLGNICRSAMAEGILRKKIAQENLKIIIDSAGTCNNHVGQAPDNRMKTKALAHNIDISNLVARQFTVSDFDKFDYIFAMDEANKKDILSLARNKNDSAKVELFLNLSYPNKNLSVPDPYFGGERGFEDVFQLLNTTCNKLIIQLKNE